MDKWQLSRYLIDAKKCVDSMLYIKTNSNRMRNLDLYEIIENKLRHFYINLCIIFGNSFEKEELKRLKREDNVVNSIYYERDKNYAHKDCNYEKKNIKDLNEIIKKMKKELEHCKKKCNEKLPDIISLDYVSHDRNLFRFVNSISPNLEDKINSTLYNNEEGIISREYRNFYNTEDIKMVKNKQDYAVVLENGLIYKEGLQNRQDACIKINVLYDGNIWVPKPSNCDNRFHKNEKEFINFINILR